MPYALPDPDDPSLRRLADELAGGPDPDDDPFGDDALLDEAFPLGDGTADTDGAVVCPYCGALVEIALDPGGGALQQYVEDCAVCCQPWRLTVRWDATGAADVRCDADDALLD